MATVPTPYTATAGDKLSAVTFNAGVKDPLNFLLDPPRCEVAMTANTAITSSLTLVTWDNEITDNDNMHNTASQQSRIVIQTPGRFLFYISTFMSSATYTQYDINLRINSGGSAAGGSSVRTWSVGSPGGASRQITLSGSRYMPTTTDYFELFVATTPNGNLTGGLGVFATGMQVIWKSLT